MQSVGSFFSTVSKFYNELNPATLSGAIDVVVVEQADGELACSPFHVRFGKLSILRPQEKVVEVTINGRVVDFPMKVGDAGEAFFVFETEQDVPEEFATSPLAGPTTDKVEEDIDYLDLAQENSTTHPPNDIETGYVSAHSGHGSEFEEDERSDLSPELGKKLDYASAVKYGDAKEPGRHVGSHDEVATPVHAFMEQRVQRWSITMSLPPSPVLKARDIMENFQPIDSAGPFDESRENAEHLLEPKPISANIMSNSGSWAHPQDDVIMDMTGYKTEDSAGETDLASDASGEQEADMAEAFSYQTPGATTAAQESEWSWGWGSLPVKNDGLGTGGTEPKEHHSSHLSIDIQTPAKPILNDMEIDGTKYRLAISLCPGDEFGKDLEASEALFAANQVSFDEFAKDPLKILNNKSLVCLINDRYGVRVESIKDTTLHQPGETRYESSVRELEPMTRSTSLPIDEGIAGSMSDRYTGNPQPTPSAHKNSKRFAKTLRLTSEQLKSLNLKKGANTLTFSVTSSYQGKAVCSAKLFLWDYDYQVVISDIDGTITKSDALGHIFTMAGKDWTHSGVAKLYTDIVNNGYHILYLTSRAIGQADYTRKYLKNVEQNNYQLPDGPVIMSPDRLMTAFHREVIMRKPEEFKMACLRDIRRLFGDRNPFYAGFGNRITDALSYRSVNVPSSRIFTIDSGGEVKLELLSSYKSSYLALNDLVNEIFPGKRQAPEFNDWNFWRAPLPSIELPIAPSQQYTPTAVPGDYNAQGYSTGPGRMGVIRSLTSSLTSAGPLKTRSSIPTFTSSSSTAPHSYPSMMKPHSPLQSQSTSSPPPPASAPSGLQIADRTRRLSLSLMRYSSQPTASSAPALRPLTDSPEVNVGMIGSDAGAVSEGHHAPLGPQGSPLLGSDPQGLYPVDVPDMKRKVSGFSVSPPQLASRLSETVMPFLRRRASKLEQEQEQEQEQQREQEQEHAILAGATAEEDQPFYPRKDGEEQAAAGYLEDEHEFEGGFEGKEGDGAEGYVGYYEEGEEGLEEDPLEGDEDEDEDEDEDDDDVELNIDAPFL
ncbi:hypothetical protein EC968_002198 [Mortierella alpina]|nr:hypothetical protein EC968_002198 [Mortierella alpina]